MRASERERERANRENYKIKAVVTAAVAATLTPR